MTDTKSKKNGDKKKKKNKDVEMTNLFTQSLKNEYLKDVSDKLIVPEEDRLNVAWDIQKYKVTVRTPCKPPVKKTVLNNSKGFCKPGTITAIIGPSGAGKTSLLRILAQKIGNSEYKGNVYVNGNICPPTYFQKVSGFVAQEDIIMGTQTAKETLMFAANLKLPKETREEREKVVDTLLSSVGLSHVAENLVGHYGTAAINSTLKGRLSGGERKRLSICIELVNNPSILYLDEPTSGLDSYAALVVIQNLRKLAFMGRTVICSVHQPSSEMVKLFDNLILLSDGHTAYSGPTDQAVSYFSQMGYECPKYVNPIEHLVNVVQQEQHSEEEEERDVESSENITEKKNLEIIYEHYRDSLYSNYSNKLIDEIVESPVDLPETQKIGSSNSRQMGLLLGRMFRNIWREPRLFRVRLIIGIFTSLLAGLIWIRMPQTFTGGTDRIASSFFLVNSIMFSASSGPITLFAVERAIYYREHNGGFYGAGAFYLSKMLSELPMNLLSPIVSSSIGFWLMGLHDNVENYLLFTLFLILLTFVAHGMGMMLASIFDDPSTGLRVQMLIMLPLMLFSGFFLNNASIPVYFIWLQYVSPIKYAFSGAIISVLHDLPLNCTTSELVDVTITKNISIPILPPNSTGMPFPFNTTSSFPEFTETLTFNLSLCPVTSGDNILSQLDVDVNMLWLDILILVIMIVFLNLVAFLSIRFCKRTK